MFDLAIPEMPSDIFVSSTLSYGVTDDHVRALDSFRIRIRVSVKQHNT